MGVINELNQPWDRQTGAPVLPTGVTESLAAGYVQEANLAPQPEEGDQWRIKTPIGVCSGRYPEPPPPDAVQSQVELYQKWMSLGHQLAAHFWHNSPNPEADGTLGRIEQIIREMPQRDNTRSRRGLRHTQAIERVNAVPCTLDPNRTLEEMAHANIFKAGGPVEIERAEALARYLSQSLPPGVRLHLANEKHEEQVSVDAVSVRNTWLDELPDAKELFPAGVDPVQQGPTIIIARPMAWGERPAHIAYCQECRLTPAYGFTDGERFWCQWCDKRKKGSH